MAKKRLEKGIPAVVKVDGRHVLNPDARPYIVPDLPVGSFLARWNGFVSSAPKKNVVIVVVSTQKDFKLCTADCMRRQLDFVATQFPGTMERHQVVHHARKRIQSIGKGLS